MVERIQLRGVPTTAVTLRSSANKKVNKHVSWWVNSATIQKELAKQADQTKFLKTILTCEGVLRFVDVFVSDKTPQGVGVEQWSIVSSMSTGSCCSPWWINSCNLSLGFWWIGISKFGVVSTHEKSGWCGWCMYDDCQNLTIWSIVCTVMEIGKILFPNRSMPPWEQIYDVETGEILVKFPYISPLYCCTSLQIFSKNAAKLCAAASWEFCCAAKFLPTRNRSFHKLFFSCP